MKKIGQAKIKKGTRVLLRADFNVPMKNNKIVDPFRIDKTYKTIDYIIKKGGILTIISHIGDKGEETLQAVYAYMKKKYGTDISFFEGPITKHTVPIINTERKTQIVLVENLRQNSGEKKNSAAFSKLLSELGDVYINDAFSVSHREHASIFGVPAFIEGYAGFQLQDEVKHLSKVFTPKHPFVFILGGDKFSTKLPLLKKFEKKADTVFVGGALLNDVLLSVGFPVGTSLVENNKKVLPQLAELYTRKNFIAPDDVVVCREGKSINVSVNDVKKTDAIFDVGKETLAELLLQIENAKLVLWNGPLGKYTDGYDKASKKLLKALSVAKAEVIIGGGDTVALVSKMKLENEFSFVSTGGGATLDFLTHGTLPGITVLK